MTTHTPAHVFLSYAPENEDAVEAVAFRLSSRTVASAMVHFAKLNANQAALWCRLESTPQPCETSATGKSSSTSADLKMGCCSVRLGTLAATWRNRSNTRT
jgi:hypothetical protein